MKKIKHISSRFVVFGSALSLTGLCLMGSSPLGYAEQLKPQCDCSTDMPTNAEKALRVAYGTDGGTPKCPDNCLTSTWRQWACYYWGSTGLKFYHDFTVYTCTGETYWNCDGYDWIPTEETCPGPYVYELPPCHLFNVPGQWTYCER